MAGHGRIAMQELRAAFEALGYADVSTYIQTGNVLFTTGSRGEATVAATIEERLAEDFGDSPAVILRTVPELLRIGAASPFAKAGADPARHHVTFLAAAPSKKVLAALELPPSGKDELVVDGREVYVHTPNGYAGDEIHRQLPGTPSRRPQHDQELEHGDQALRAGQPALSRCRAAPSRRQDASRIRLVDSDAAGNRDPNGSPSEAGAPSPTAPHTGPRGRPTLNSAVKRRRADRAFYIRLAGAIRQNERALERLQR